MIEMFHVFCIQKIIANYLTVVYLTVANPTVVYLNVNPTVNLTVEFF